MSRSYRITYDHRSGKFVIEVMGFAGLTWSAARESGKARYFETFDEASSYVKVIGLDRVYTDFTFKPPFGTTRAGGVYPSAPEKPVRTAWIPPSPRYPDPQTFQLHPPIVKDAA